MTDWREATIGSLGRVVTGTTPPAKRPEWFGDVTAFITPSDISAGDRRARPQRLLSRAGVQALQTRLLPAGSVCFVCIGATIGKLCLTDFEAITNQQINTIVPGDCTDGTFVYYLLRHDASRIARTAGGAATPILNKGDFADISVRVPDHRTQQRIAEVLGSFDDLIENNQRRIEALERMAWAVYREWFVRFRYPGHEDATVVDSPIGPIPNGWRVKPFAEIASFVNGFAFKPSHWGTMGRPIIKIKELKNGVTPDTPRCDEHEILKKYWVSPGDLLFKLER